MERFSFDFTKSDSSTSHGRGSSSTYPKAPSTQDPYNRILKGFRLREHADDPHKQYNRSSRKDIRRQDSDFRTSYSDFDLAERNASTSHEWGSTHARASSLQNRVLNTLRAPFRREHSEPYKPKRRSRKEIESLLWERACVQQQAYQYVVRKCEEKSERDRARGIITPPDPYGSDTLVWEVPDKRHETQFRSLQRRAKRLRRQNSELSSSYESSLSLSRSSEPSQEIIVNNPSVEIPSSDIESDSPPQRQVVTVQIENTSNQGGQKEEQPQNISVNVESPREDADQKFSLSINNPSVEISSSEIESDSLPERQVVTVQIENTSNQNGQKEEQPQNISVNVESPREDADQNFSLRKDDSPILNEVIIVENKAQDSPATSKKSKDPKTVRFPNKMAVTNSNLCCMSTRACQRSKSYVTILFFLFLAAGVTGLILYGFFKEQNRSLDKLMKQLADMQSHITLIEMRYQNRQQVMASLQNEAHMNDYDDDGQTPSTLSTQLSELLTNLTEYPETLKSFSHPTKTGMKRYIDPSELTDIYNNGNTKLYYKPAFYKQSKRKFCENVIGVPSIKRGKDSYLMTTLKYLVEGLRNEDYNDTLIVVMIGEVDMLDVVNVAKVIELSFKKELEDGLIEIISPEKDFYPDLSTIPVSLGDSLQRVQWRTKQNLDAIFLMSYAKLKGLHYLMMEDDVITKPNYMQEIKTFTASTTISHPEWIILDFCSIGGIGKLLKVTNLAHFTAYVDLFYVNMPLDWLIDSYVANRVCGIDKVSKECTAKKDTVRIQYKSSLFQHIGIHSSLKGKVQMIKDPRFGTMPTFFPNKNPPVSQIICSIEEQSGHTISDIYEGRSYFWGTSPKKDNYVEFIFKNAIKLRRYKISTGNYEHLLDIFKETDVRVRKDDDTEYTVISEFNPLGVARGELPEDFGAISVLKIQVNADSDVWVIINEIKLETDEDIKT